MGLNSPLLEVVRIDRVMAGVVAGTTDQNSSSVDMQADGGYQGVQFIGLFGVLSATQVTSMKVSQSADDSNWNDLEASDTGNMDDGDDDLLLACDIYKPTDRYVRATILRGTGNAVIDGVVALLYSNRDVPVTQPADVALSVALVTPDEGTA